MNVIKVECSNQLNKWISKNYQNLIFDQRGNFISINAVAVKSTFLNENVGNRTVIFDYF